MNKITFFFFFLISFVVNAQFSLETSIGRIKNGERIKTQTLEETGSDLRFSIVNDAEEEVGVRLVVKSLSNTNGNDFELCFGGECHKVVREGAVYPRNDKGYYLIDSRGIFDKGLNRLWNHKSVGETPGKGLSYEFEFQQIDLQSGKVLERLSFTYVYERPDDEETPKPEVKVHLPKTVIRDGNLALKAQEPLVLQVFNLIGREVKHENVRSGWNEIDISDLSAQIYILRFQNQQGMVKTQKIVVD